MQKTRNRLNEILALINIDRDLIYCEKKSEAYLINKKVNKFDQACMKIGGGLCDHYLIALSQDNNLGLITETELKHVNSNLYGLAKYKGKKQTVHTRVAYSAKKEVIYIFDGKNNVYRIDGGNIDINSDKKIRFNMLENFDVKLVPKPDVENCNINLLQSYINTSEDDYKLIVTFILNCFFTNSHYPLLLLNGVAGSGKSIITQMIKTLVDPSPVMLRNQFESKEDLVIAVQHCHLVDLNNCKPMKKLEDTLCTILSGGVLTKRKKFTDSKQTVLYTHNPVVVNGIGETISQDDLLDRTIKVRTRQFDGDGVDLKPETQLLAEFKQDLPYILGGILVCLQKVLSRKNAIEQPKSLPRMADFYLFGLAVEKAMDWEKNSFKHAFYQNQKAIHNEILDDSKLAQAIIKLIAIKNEYFGSMKSLLDALISLGEINISSPRLLSSEIDRITIQLQRVKKIIIKREGRSNKGVMVRIYREVSA